MKGTCVQSLIKEDPTCRRAVKPGHHYWAHMLQLLKPVSLEPVLHNKSSCDKKTSHHEEEQPLAAATREKAAQQQWRQPSQKQIKREGEIMEWTHIPPAMPSSNLDSPGPPPTRQTLTEKKKISHRTSGPVLQRLRQDEVPSFVTVTIFKWTVPWHIVHSSIFPMCSHWSS